MRWMKIAVELTWVAFHQSNQRVDVWPKCLQGTRRSRSVRPLFRVRLSLHGHLRVCPARQSTGHPTRATRSERRDRGSQYKVGTGQAKWGSHCSVAFENVALQINAALKEWKRKGLTLYRSNLSSSMVCVIPDRGRWYVGIETDKRQSSKKLHGGSTRG